MAAIIFGLVALVWPGPTLTVLVYMFGAFVFVDGITTLAALAKGGVLARRHAWATGLSGVLGIVFAGVTFFWPSISAMTLLYMVAFWSISTGVLQIISAIELRRAIPGEGWMIAGGVLSIVFGTLLIMFPGTGLVSLVWLVGMYAIMFGSSSLAMAYRLHRVHRDIERVVTPNQTAGVA
ncbi:MAG: HdeD family acid-resistance protein [Actinobacteria bacterium]|nr:HdeD family acid-resistance protein [Actinomycetota bacterium]